MENNKKNNKKKGFTLIEVLVALFVFIVTITAATGSFASLMSANKKIKEIQKSTEDAQFVMNLIAKTIRTSRIKTADSGGHPVSAIEVYDYSQKKCIAYKIIDNKEMKYGTIAPSIPDNFDSCDFSSIVFFDIVNSDVSGGFIIEKDSPFDIISVVLQVCSAGMSSCDASSPQTVKIQTSVSVRKETI